MITIIVIFMVNLMLRQVLLNPPFFKGFFKTTRTEVSDLLSELKQRREQVGTSAPGRSAGDFKDLLPQLICFNKLFIWMILIWTIYWLDFKVFNHDKRMVSTRSLVTYIYIINGLSSISFHFRNLRNHFQSHFQKAFRCYPRYLHEFRDDLVHFYTLQ